MGCAGQAKLADYQPKSTEEKEVLDLIIKADTTNDLSEHLACYHDNASIKIPERGEYQRTGSKQEYKEALEKGFWNDIDRDTLVGPTIMVMGDKATVKCSNHSEGITFRHTFDLIKENEKWFIVKHNWEWR